MPSPSRRLRVLTLTHNYPRFIGDPAGAFVARVAEGVAADGHEVEAIAPHAPGTLMVEEVRGVRVHRFRYAPDFLERVAYTGGLHHRAFRAPSVALALPAFFLAFGHAVRSAVRRMHPHVIHAHWWLPGGWYASRTRVPYVITSHGSDVRLLERSSFLRTRARTVYRGAGRVTAVSRFLVEDLTRMLAPDAPSVSVTPMPVDVDSFRAGSAAPKAIPPRILYAGNLVLSKGVDLLLHAAAELNRRGVEYQVKILGQGPEQEALRALARRLVLDTRIIWSPFVPQDQMPAEYGASTVTVLPSRGSAEGLGLTLVEALLAGSAVVGTPAGGIPEVVRHEETGLLARDEDPLSLAEQIQRLLTDASLRERLIGAGRAYALATYSPEPAVQRFLEIYHALADDQPNR